MVEKILNIASNFDIAGTPIDAKLTGSGNINNTFEVTFSLNDGNRKKYILQKINSVAFKNPYSVMKNIDLVLHEIKRRKKKIRDTRQTLEIINTKDGNNLFVITNEFGEKEFYRLYSFIENAISYDNSKDLKTIYSVGKAFGNFQKLLSDFSCDDLEETIPFFHDTRKRYNNFIVDIEKDVVGRVKDVGPEISFIKDHSYLSNLLVGLLEKGSIPYRVCHNDTKISNVMINSATNEFEAVIDLDTIMPGCAGFDFGDGVRSATALSVEDEKDLSKVGFDMNLLDNYVRGYLEEVCDVFDIQEVMSLSKSIEVITYELALRFLDDYINGDVYFNTKYPDHNLVRAKNQIKLLESFINEEISINNKIIDIYNSLKNK